MTKRNGFCRTSLLALLTGGALAMGGPLLGHPLLLCGPPPARAAELSLGGNATSLLVGTGQSGSWSWRIQEDLRLKVAGRGPGAGSWQGEFVLSSGTTAGSSIPGGGEGGTGSEDSFRIDRLFLEWDDGLTRVTLGRQRIAWGVGYAFSPLDQFNPPNPLDPSAPRLGADALVLRRSTGDLSYLSAVGVLLQTGGTSPAAAGANPAAGAIWGFHAARTDVALSYLADPAKALHQWGLAAKGDLGVGWHLEGVYQKPWAGAEDGRWLGVLGLDYSFLDGQLVCLGEYFYDGTGEPDPARYDYTLLREGKRRLLGDRYLFGQASYQVDEFTSASLAGLANLADGSLLLQPTLGWLVDDRLRVDLGLAVPLGKEGTEFKVAAPEAALTVRARYSF